MSMISFSAGGINVAEIVGGLMQAERMPLATIQNRQAAVRLQVAALNSVKSGLANLRTQALALDTAFTKLTGTSSSTAVTASVGSSGAGGSLSFTVDQIAQAHGLRTAGTVASSGSPITNNPLLAVSSTSSALGIGTVRAGAGLGAGTHQISVTQATTGATRTGAGPLAALTTIDASNDQLELEVDGIARTVSLAHGSYTANDLARAVEDALAADGSHATARLDNQGRLAITTSHEGSLATLRVAGGTALGALGLSVDGAASTGTDGIVTVGTESVTITSTSAGPIAIDTGTGDLELEVSSGLRVGNAKVAVVSTGDGSLASVAGAINAAKIGVSASAVRLTEGAWTLQLSAASTGTAGAIAIASDAFSGGIVETSAARDANITIGSGAGAYSITGTGNTFSDVMPGVVLTTSAVSATPVTVNVAKDDAATADAVKDLIDKANVLLAQIATQTKSEPGAAGPLAGQNVVRQLANDVRSAVTAMVPGSTTGYASSVGISLTREGRLSFDRSQFLTALAEDPDAVERLFGKGGTGTNGVAYGAASDKTVPGTYAIEITTPATRATSGPVLTGGLGGVQQLAVRIGDATVTYETAAGATATEIANGLRAALSSAGLGIVAEVEGNDVRLRSSGYGSSFEVSNDPGDPGSWQTFAGTSVAGTIDGQPAIGLGNRLRLLDLSTSNARGLEVTVGEDAVGPAELAYQPGIGARVVALDSRLTAENGSLTLTGNGFENRIKAFNTQIDKFEERMERMEARLVRQWASIQTLLQGLQSQGDWLGSQISSMNRSSG